MPNCLRDAVISGEVILIHVHDMALFSLPEDRFHLDRSWLGAASRCYCMPLRSKRRAVERYNATRGALLHDWFISNGVGVSKGVSLANILFSSH